jgi:hypothetical protein
MTLFLPILDVKFDKVFEIIQESLKEITSVNILDDLIQFAKKCDTFDKLL